MAQQPSSYLGGDLSSIGLTHWSEFQNFGRGCLQLSYSCCQCQCHVQQLCALGMLISKKGLFVNKEMFSSKSDLFVDPFVNNRDRAARPRTGVSRP